MRTARVRKMEYDTSRAPDKAVAKANLGKSVVINPVAGLQEKGVGIDATPGKLIAISVLFLILFVFPVTIYNNWKASHPAGAYSVTIVDPNATGRVAGAATGTDTQTNQLPATQTTSTVSTQGANQVPNIAGIPLSYLFVGIGAAMVGLTYFILKR